MRLHGRPRGRQASKSACPWQIQILQSRLLGHPRCTIATATQLGLLLPLGLSSFSLSRPSLGSNSSFHVLVSPCRFRSRTPSRATTGNRRDFVNVTRPLHSHAPAHQTVCSFCSICRLLSLLRHMCASASTRGASPSVLLPSHAIKIKHQTRCLLSSNQDSTPRSHHLQSSAQRAERLPHAKYIPSKNRP